MNAFNIPRGDPLANARWADPAYIAGKYYYEPGDIWLGRNPHNFDQAIGVKPDEHIFMCASTGSGKGRSVIVNNIALWPGSLVVYDPKGDLPAICAPARGEGDEWSSPLGQKTIVLDPLGYAKSDRKYLGYYDPLSSLDPSEPGYRGQCKFIAETLLRVPESQNHAEWAKMGRGLIKTIIEHVVSSELFDPDQRNLFSILNLLKKGRKDAQLEWVAEQLDAGKISREEYNEKVDNLPDPFRILFQEIAQTGASQYLRDDGDKLLTIYKNTPRTFVNQLDEAIRGLDWITDDLRMEEALIGTRNGVPTLSSTQKFDPRELKTNPAGVSLFIVLPSDQMEGFGAWVQCVLMGIFSIVRKTPADPKVTHPILGILDEFSSLGKQEYIANAFDTLRDEGMRLMLVVQQAGWLMDTYGKRGESFMENTSAQLYFGRVGETATDYLVKAIGETEIIKHAVTYNKSHARMDGSSTSEATSEQTSIAESETTTNTFGTTDTEQQSRTHTDGRTRTKNENRSRSKSKNFNWNNSVNWTDGRNWGEGTGQNMGRNYGPHIFWEGLEHSTNYGSSLNKSKGGSHSEGGAKARGGGNSVTDQVSSGSSDALSTSDAETLGSSRATTSSVATAKGKTQTETTGETHTDTTNESDTYTHGSSIAQSFHKKPLVAYSEFRMYLGRVPDAEHDHPAYPGLMLAIIGRESPVLLRRSNYDQDRFFDGLYSKHPKYPMLSHDQQPMLGYEFTPENVFDLCLPELLEETGYQLNILVQPYRSFQPGTALVEVVLPDGEIDTLRSNFAGRALNVGTREDPKLRVRVWDRDGSAHAKTESDLIFLPHVEVEEQKIAAEQRRQEAIEQKIREEEERQNRELAAAQAEKKRLEEQAIAKSRDYAKRQWEYYRQDRESYAGRFWLRMFCILLAAPLWGSFLAMIASVLVLLPFKPEDVAVKLNWFNFLCMASAIPVIWIVTSKNAAKRKKQVLEKQRKLRYASSLSKETEPDDLVDLNSMYQAVPNLNIKQAWLEVTES